MAGKYDYEIDQGRDWARFIQLFTDCTKTTPIDLTGYTAVFQLKKALEDVSFAAEASTANGRVTIDGVNGKVLWVLPDTVTDPLTGEYYYELVLTSGTGDESAILKGMASISPKVVT